MKRLPKRVARKRLPPNLKRHVRPDRARRGFVEDVLLTEYHPELDRLVWGARDIAAIINRNERQTFFLLEQGLIDGTKIGGRWVSSPRRLLFGGR